MKIKDALKESFKDAAKKFSNDVNDETIKKYFDMFKQLKSRNLITGQEADISYWIKHGWASFKQFVDSNENKQSKSAVKKQHKKMF